MLGRLIVAAILTIVLYWLLDDDPSGGDDSPRLPAAAATRLLLLGLLSWVALEWTRSVRPFADAFPVELSPSLGLALQLASVVLGLAAFAAARGRRGFLPGAAFGVVSAATGLCASRWPQLSRAIELCGGGFPGFLLSALLMPALALTHVVTAAALLREEWRAVRRQLLWGAVLLWASGTFATQALLTEVWGFGPRTLAAAAEVATNQNSQRFSVAWLYPTMGRPYHIESRRMSSQNTDLSMTSISRLEAFLERTRFRGIFARDALAAVRLGYLQWWEAERALDAAMIAIPGRVHPDYPRALELLRAGPLTAARLAKLDRLSALTGRRVEGFEHASDAQIIFEGFSAAYARFGDEVKSQEWLRRIDDLWAVRDKRVEATPLADFGEGRIDGAVLLNGRAGRDLRVGLFLVWLSSTTQATHYWLSGSRAPDDEGRFSFTNLGPGRYALALLGRPEDLRGPYRGEPGYIELSYEHPEVRLKEIRIGRAAPPP